jgi:hypothetical protein
MSDSEWTEALEDEPVDEQADDELTEDWMFVALTDLEASLEGAE